MTYLKCRSNQVQIEFFRLSKFDEDKQELCFK